MGRKIDALLGSSAGSATSMGRKIDALLGRSFKLSKLKALLNLTVSRIAILKNQKKTRGSLARSDVTELLKQGQEERALLRVEHVIKEQNMLDVFVMMEGYCYLLMERGVLLEDQRSCPEELKEAISSLVFAASRCGELPELQELRSVFTTRFGKEFTAAAVELRNNCGVNIKMMQKMSTRQPSLEIRMKVLREIAAENGITLSIEEVSSDSNENQSQPKPNEVANVGGNYENSVELDEEKAFSGILKAKEKFTDVETAAQVAFEAAAYAAEAARAAVELSRTESSDDQSRSPRGKTKSDRNKGEGSSRSRFHRTPAAATPKSEHITNESGFEKVHPVQNSSSESENEELVENGEKAGERLERSISSSDSGEIEANEVDWIKKAFEKDIHFDGSDDETSKGNEENPYGETRFDKNHFTTKADKSSEIHSKASNPRGRTGFGFEKASEFEAVSNNEFSGKVEALYHQKQTPIGSPTYDSVDEVVDSPGKLNWQDSKAENFSDSFDMPKKLPQKGTRFVSVRTRRGSKQ